VLALVRTLPSRQAFRDPIAAVGDYLRAQPDVSETTLMGRRVVVIKHPDLVEKVLVEHAADYGRGALIGAMRRVVGDGVLTSTGDEHYRQRRMLMPAFSGQRVAQWSEQILDMLAVRGRVGPGERDVKQWMGELSLAMSAQILLGLDLGKRTPSLVRAARTVTGDLPAVVASTYLGGWSRLSPRLGRARSALTELREFVDGVVRQRRRRPGGCDLLSSILDSEPSDERARDQIMTLLIAGHGPLAHALTWTWYLLARDQELQRKFHREMAGVLGSRMPRATDVPRLLWVRNLFKEAMRLSPPGWVFNRRVVRAHTLGGVHLRPGDVVALSPYWIHRDPRFWDDPEEVNPDRWLGDKADRRPRFAYMPYSYGPRSCIAAALAQQQGVLILASLGQRYRFWCPQDTRLRLRPLFTLQVRGPVKMTLSRRGSVPDPVEAGLQLAPA